MKLEIKDKRQLVIKGFDEVCIPPLVPLQAEPEADKTKLKRNSKRYYIHAQLRKNGHEVISEERFVIKKERVLTAIDEKRVRELIDLGYCITDRLFD